MKCESVNRKLADYVDGRCGPITRARIRRHLSGCEGCAEGKKEDQDLNDHGELESRAHAQNHPGQESVIAIRRPDQLKSQQLIEVDRHLDRTRDQQKVGKSPSRQKEPKGRDTGRQQDLGLPRMQGRGHKFADKKEQER